MENQDNLFNKIKSAAENAENKDFQSMEKVWSRIDAKLDTTVQKKDSKKWNKLAIAASIVVSGLLVFLFLKQDEKILVPQNKMVVIDSTKNTIEIDKTTENEVAIAEKPNKLIKEDADAILKKQIESPTQLAVNDTVISESPRAVASSEITAIKNDASNTASSNTNGNWAESRKFESRGVAYKDAVAETKIANEESKKAKQKPLVVIDNKVSKKAVSVDDEELESLVELKEPLYIINGIYYSEEDLFGENPTSPYAPLNNQEIETISVLQDEKATSIYGEKGKKGVVIITTKNGKPKPKK